MCKKNVEDRLCDGDTLIIKYPDVPPYTWKYLKVPRSTKQYLKNEGARLVVVLALMIKLAMAISMIL